MRPVKYNALESSLKCESGGRGVNEMCLLRNSVFQYTVIKDRGKVGSFQIHHQFLH